MLFEIMAKEHWRKNLPNLTKELEKAGTFDQATKEAGQKAAEQLAIMVAKGYQLEESKEQVLKEYILLPPESTE